MGKFSSGVEGVYQSARGGIKDYIKKQKVLLIVLLFVALVSVLTGVFTAIKNADNYSSVWFDNYNIINFYNSEIGTWELFFNRFGSYLICLGVVFICSFNIFLSPFSIVVLVIRSYLVGLNCCFMFLLFGLSGMLTTIIIILPINKPIAFDCILFPHVYSCAKQAKIWVVLRRGRKETICPISDISVAFHTC